MAEWSQLVLEGAMPWQSGWVFRESVTSIYIGASVLTMRLHSGLNLCLRVLCRGRMVSTST